MKPQIVMLIPLGDAPSAPGHPDNTLPRPDRPVDPGYGRPDWSGRPDNSLPWGPGRPDNALPTPPVDPSWGVTPPVDPGYGRPGWSPVDPGWGQGHPGGHPGNTLPNAPVRPDNSLPLPPDSTVPPGSIYPPVTQLHTKTAVLAWLPGYGARWIVLGPSVTPTA